MAGETLVGKNNLESFQGRSRIELGLGGRAGFRSVEGKREPWNHCEALTQAARRGARREAGRSVSGDGVMLCWDPGGEGWTRAGRPWG